MAISACRVAGGDRRDAVSPAGQTNYGICSTDFLDYAFRTDSYRQEISFDADGNWKYVSDTMLLVRVRAKQS